MKVMCALGVAALVVVHGAMCVVAGGQPVEGGSSPAVTSPEQPPTLESLRKRAEAGDADAQFQLGVICTGNRDVVLDEAAAVDWFTRAAEQGHADAQFHLGILYQVGGGVPQSNPKAVAWYKRAARQGHTIAQFNLAAMYWRGEGTLQDHVVAYSWADIAAAGGYAEARSRRDSLAKEMSRAQIANAQSLASAFTPKIEPPGAGAPSDEESRSASVTGSGFFVSADGYFVTNHHVIANGKHVKVRTRQDEFEARVVQQDASNDLAVLKIEGTFQALHVLGSGRLRLADRVSTIGFPNPDLQGFAAKFSGGEVAALSGPADDPRFIQISVPLQPGNSGGALVDASGSVVGVVTGKLALIETLRVTGQIPENVNYAIKGTILLGVLESIPGLSDKLQTRATQPPKEAAEVAKLVEAASAMVIVE